MQYSLLKRMIFGAILLSNTTLAIAGLSAQHIVEKGSNSGATACATCHGSDGTGNAASGIPRLAGLNQTYLTKQLNDFKSGKRNNPLMNGIAQGLDDTEVRDLASYFSGLTTRMKTKAVDKKLHKQGENLAVYGNWDNDIPACFRCHGDQARGGGPAMPALAGQHQNYIQAQLQAWKAGARNNDPVGLMTAIAGRMSDVEIRAVSAYLASLTPTAAQ